MAFRDFPSKDWTELLPEVPSEARDLASRLVRYQSTERLSASEVPLYPSVTLSKLTLIHIYRR